MHVLLAALAGGAFAVLAVSAFALVQGQRPTLKNLLLAGLGGAIAGAVTAATLGASAAAGGVGLTRQAVSFAAGGAAGGATERVADNYVEGRDLDEGVLKSTALGAGVGLASLGATKAVRAVGVRAFPKAFTGTPTSWFGRLASSYTPGTGGSWLRGAGGLPGAGTGVHRSVADKKEKEQARAKWADQEARLTTARERAARERAAAREQAAAQRSPSRGLANALH